VAGDGDPEPVAGRDDSGDGQQRHGQVHGVPRNHGEGVWPGEGPRHPQARRVSRAGRPAVQEAQAALGQVADAAAGTDALEVDVDRAVGAGRGQAQRHDREPEDMETGGQRLAGEGQQRVIGVRAAGVGGRPAQVDGQPPVHGPGGGRGVHPVRHAPGRARLPRQAGTLTRRPQVPPLRSGTRGRPGGDGLPRVRAQSAEGQGAWPGGLAVPLQVPGEELDKAAVLAPGTQRVMLHGARCLRSRRPPRWSQGVGEAAAAVAPGPDLDLLMAGLGHEPGQRPRREAAVEPARADQHRDP
jgi:hypothetical protein